jgi:hypothetical protein
MAMLGWQAFSSSGDLVLRPAPSFPEHAFLGTHAHSVCFRHRIGDAVLTTGLLAHLLRTHPGVRITVACGSATEGGVVRMPGLEATLMVAKHPPDRNAA